MEERVFKIFSHNDLDGYAAPVLLRQIVRNRYKHVKEKIGITFLPTTYSSTGKSGSIDNDILNFLESDSVKRTDKIYITDLTPSENVLEKLLKKSNEYGFEWGVVDHHKTALWAKEKYPDNVFIEIKAENENLQCATSLVLELALATLPNYSMGVNSLNYVEAVRRYDTWEWSKLPNTSLSLAAINLNNLFYFMLVKDREEMLELCLNKGVHQFLENNSGLVNILKEKEKKYIKKKIESVEFATLNNKFLISVVNAEEYVSNLGNQLAKLEYKGRPVDFSIVIQGSDRVSLRTVKEDVDVSKIAEQVFGGGGHAKAAGGKFDKVIYMYEIKNNGNLEGLKFEE
ncbi:DHHA1 domain-containing protein [Liquorilactobacillus hordei]|uniref:DHH family phosphoesterase n=1 Tax=Liquorilactobacillus hordei DSM 19519 TaxID=1423759 RepID=A0A0R1MJ42_9LACO|nr:DHHA1 domain-containing protein [Liquorilactobacillus hordei]KRL08016.1 DHH family phosphoesterase [Liquorilactobacillus hordei DSM 19519]QYH51037.1 hypothetical protein G6O70_00290 [Liquorilactobacillus hordei DSM 19519]